MTKPTRMVLLGILFGCLGAACTKEPDITVLENRYLSVVAGPTILADELSDPMAPLFIEGELIFAESGKGTINRLKDGKVVPLIRGFGVDDYQGYEISVQGIEFVPDRDAWLVASAEGDGKVYVFDASRLPTEAKGGLEIKIQDETSLNPFGVVLVDGDLLVASGGTRKAYQVPIDFEDPDPNPLLPVFEVDTGLAGLATDPRSGEVYGAVIGSGRRDGEVIRWDPKAQVIEPQTVAKGFNNLVDVTFTPDGLLLALEFGSFGKENTGRVLIIEKTGRTVPFITGLAAPSGFHLDSKGNLVVTTFGKAGVADGTLVSLRVEARDVADRSE